MGKPKILFTSHTANFQKFNRPFMRMLREQGHEVHYASMGEEEILDADKSFVVPFTRSPFKTSNIQAYKQLKEIIDRENYDIIHTHTPMGSVVTRLAARAARKKGTRVIYTAHGFHFFTGAPLANWLIYYPVEKWMARHTDTLITINNEDYQRAKKKFKTDVQYVPGVGVNLDRFSPVGASQKQTLRKKHGFSSDSWLLIYAAELNKNKNQSMIINALPELKKRIPSIQLILCGIGDSKDNYKNLAKKLEVDSIVSFLGYRNDLNELFQLSDICVATSIREGLGLNLIESVASGLKVVASDNRGHSDIAASIPNFVKLYPLGDQQALINAIVDTCVAQKSNIAAGTLEGFSKKYSVENALNNMSIIYQEQNNG